MDVDVALAEVPVNIMPLLDSTDFVTREIAIAYNAAGMDLVWNFVTTGGAFTQTAVTPTTAGDYDWAHQGDGIYTIEIPASAGVSINNDTEGFGWFTGFVTGVLPWRGPTIGFRAAALNNALIDGGDNLNVNVAEISDDTTAADNAELFFDGTGYAGGTTPLNVNASQLSGDATAADNAEAFFDGTGYAGTNNTIPTVTAVTNQVTANVTAISGDSVAADNVEADYDGTGYNKSASTVGTVTTLTGHTPQTGDSFARLGAPAGASIAADIAVIEGQTDDIGAAGAGLTAVPWNAAWDAEVQNEVDDALVARNLDKLVIASGTADSGSTTTLVDAALTEADADYWKGRLLLFTSGNLIGQCAIITDFNATTDTLTFAPPTTQAVSTHTYIILPSVSVWDDTLAEHLASGTTGNALNAAGSAGDPWATAVPGAYGAGTAGKIVGDNLNATVSSRAAQTTADNIETDTQDIQSRLPAALVSGRMDSDVGAIQAGAITAAAIATDAVDADALAADAVTEIQSGLATSANQTTILNRLGAFTGSGVNTVLGFFQALMRSDATTPSDLGGTYDDATDSLQAVRDRGDSAWITATGFSTHAAADVWSVATRLLTAGTNIALAKGTGVTGFNDPDSATIADAVWDEAKAGHVAAGSMGEEIQSHALSSEVSALNDLSAAQVNAEVVDALATDTYAEPGQGAPGATISLSAKINYLYKAFRNRHTQTATTYSLYDDAATTVDQKATVSDDATTFERGEIGTGP
jgi:hypothetical protein